MTISDSQSYSSNSWPAYRSIAVLEDHFQGGCKCFIEKERWLLISPYFKSNQAFVFPISQDALQEMYNKEGKFPGPTIIPPRRLWTLLNFLFWATLLLSPLINFACGVVVSGSPLLIIGFILFLIIGGLSFTFCDSLNFMSFVHFAVAVLCSFLYKSVSKRVVSKLSTSCSLVDLTV